MSTSREVEDLANNMTTTTTPVAEIVRTASVVDFIDDFKDQRRRSLDQDSTSHADSSSAGDRVLSDFNNYIISFASMFRVKVHWSLFNSYYFLLDFFCLCMIVTSNLPWGSRYMKLFRLAFYIRTFGLDLAPLIVRKVLIALFASLFGIIIILMMLSYRYYSQGNIHFNKLKVVVLVVCGFCSLFSVQINFLFVSMLECTKDGQLEILGGRCFGSSTIGWSIVSICCILFQIFLTAFTAFSFCVTSLGGRSSMLSMDSFYFLVYDQLFILLLSILRIFVHFTIWLRPAFVLWQAITFLVVLFATVPFYNKRANSLKSGMVTSKLLLSIVCLVTSLSNDNEKDPKYELRGIILGSVAIGSLVVGFVIGFLVMEAYMLILFKSMQKIEDKIRNSESKGINTYMLNIYIRLCLCMKEETRLRAEKLLKLCNLYGIESCNLLITQAVINIYFHRDNPLMANRFLKKAANLRPNIIQKLTIVSRYNDLDMELGVDSENSKVTQMIAQGKKKQREYYQLITHFWKQLLDKKIDYQLLERTALDMHNCVSDLERIYNNMFAQWPKRPNVVRNYAEYIENIKWNQEAATTYQTEAEDLEAHLERLARMRRSAFNQNREDGGIDRADSMSFIGSNTIVPLDGDITVETQAKRDARHREAEDIESENQSEISELPVDNRTRTSLDDHTRPELRKHPAIADTHSVTDISRDQSAASKNLLRQVILTSNPSYFYRILILSIPIVIIGILCIALIMDVKGMKKPNTLQLMNGCSIQIFPYDIVSKWRQIHARQRYSLLNNKYVEQILEAIKYKMTFVLSTVEKQSKLSFHGDKRRIPLLRTELHEVVIPAVTPNSSNYLDNAYYQVNSTVLDIAKGFSLSLWETNTTIGLTTTSFVFMYVWANVELFSNALSDYCTVFYQEYKSKNSNQTMIYGWIISVIAASHLLYFFLVVLPALFFFFRQHKLVLSLFEQVPKEVIGKIYHSTQSMFGKIEQISKTKFSLGSSLLSPKAKLFICLVLILIVDAVCVALLIYDTTMQLYSDSGTSELILHAGSLGRAVNKVAFLSKELSFHDPSLNFNSTNTKDEIHALIEEVRYAWNALRFGTGTSKTGFIGYTREIDTLITNNTCLKSETSVLEETSYHCLSLDNLLQDIMFRAENYARSWPLMPISVRFAQVEVLNSLADAIGDKNRHIISLYAKHAEKKAGLGFPIKYVFLIGFVPILIMIIPVHFAVNEQRQMIHEIRKMFYFLPEEIIASIPQISNYVHDFKLRSKGRKKTDDMTDKTRTILEGSNDGVIICSEDGTVMELNSMARSQFRISDSDIVGASISSLFKQKEQFGLVLREIVTATRGLTKDFTALRTAASSLVSDSEDMEFQAKVSFSVGVWNKKKVIACFIRDCTIEQKQSELIKAEKKNSDNLLLNILPAPVALRLKKGETCIADTVEDATCFFSDMVGFTRLSSSMTAPDLVELLNGIVNTFDDLCVGHGLEKIKTIGDAYFAVGGLHGSGSDHPAKAIRFGLDIIDSLQKYGGRIQIRCGCHTGPIVAGVIGKTKFAYDVWGDTCNWASRMESTGIPGKVQCSRATYERCYDLFYFDERPGIYVKGKGEMTCYIVTGEKENRKRSSALKLIGFDKAGIGTIQEHVQLQTQQSELTLQTDDLPKDNHPEYSLNPSQSSTSVLTEEVLMIHNTMSEDLNNQEYNR